MIWICRGLYSASLRCAGENDDISLDIFWRALRPDRWCDPQKPRLFSTVRTTYVRTCLWLFISIFALLLKGDATKQFRIHLSPFHSIKAHRKMYPSKYQSANLYIYSFGFLWGLSQWFMLRTKNIASIFCSTLLLAGIFYQKTYLKRLFFHMTNFGQHIRQMMIYLARRATTMEDGEKFRI